MLAMGHLFDIKNLFQNLPSAKMAEKGEKNHMQVMMYTATLMPKIMQLVSRYLVLRYYQFSIKVL
jgi:hypothetical protein